MGIEQRPIEPNNPLQGWAYLMGLLKMKMLELQSNVEKSIVQGKSFELRKQVFEPQKSSSSEESLQKEEQLVLEELDYMFRQMRYAPLLERSALRPELIIACAVVEEAVHRELNTLGPRAAHAVFLNEQNSIHKLFATEWVCGYGAGEYFFEHEFRVIQSDLLELLAEIHLAAAVSADSEKLAQYHYLESAKWLIDARKWRRFSPHKPFHKERRYLHDISIRLEKVGFMSAVHYITEVLETLNYLKDEA